MQFFTVLVEFFLIGLLALGGLVPFLSAEEFDYLSSVIFASGETKVYLLGICYLVGIVFHFLSRVIFNVSEIGIIKRIIEGHDEFRINEHCQQFLHNSTDEFIKGSKLRRLFRMLRHSISFRSNSHFQFLKEQDQLLRITRGLILPVLLTSASLFYRYFKERNNIEVKENVVELLLIGSCSMLLLSVGAYFALRQRIKDYHRNTLAAYLSISLSAVPEGPAMVTSRLHSTEHSNYSALVFDLDGTLLNSLAAQESAWMLAVQEMNTVLRPSQHKAIIRNLFDGLSGDQMFLGTEIELSAQKALREKKDNYYRSLTGNISLFQDVPVMLNDLKKNYFLAIATTSSRKVTSHFLEKYGMSDLFSSVITADDINSPKPHPEILLKTAESLKLDTKHLLFIGDSLNDWLTARLANTDFILSRFDKRSTPDWAHRVSVINHPSELIKLLANKSKS